MEKYKIIFNIPCFITLEVEASGEEEARELASEELEVRELGMKDGFGSILAVVGKGNTLLIDTDNCYERIEDVELL